MLSCSRKVEKTKRELKGRKRRYHNFTLTPIFLIKLGELIGINEELSRSEGFDFGVGFVSTLPGRPIEATPSVGKYQTSFYNSLGGE